MTRLITSWSNRDVGVTEHLQNPGGQDGLDFIRHGLFRDPHLPPP